MRAAAVGAILSFAHPAPLAAQSSGFPERPLAASVVAGGDAGTSSNHLDAVFLNPARAAVGKGIAMGYVTHPETGLRGYSLSGAFHAVLPVALSVWRYEVADLFDEELLVSDPSLASLGVFATGVDLAIAARIGAVLVGAGSSVEFQRNLTVDRQRLSSRLGVGLDLASWMAGASWTTLPGEPSDGVGRVMLLAKPLRTPWILETGFEATWSSADGRWGLSTSVLAGHPALKMIFGWRWHDMQPAAGMLLSVDRVSLGVAREFGGRTTVGGLTALTVAMRW